MGSSPEPVALPPAPADLGGLDPNPIGMRVAHRLCGPAVLRRLRVGITGRELVPERGGVLFAANHRSFFDHYLLASASPRPMRFLGKVELAAGLFGRFNVVMGMIPVARGTGDAAALALVAALLRRGAVVGVFPEGTRSPDGALYRFRSGLARIAADAGVPTVPVGLVGAADVWPRGGRPRWRRPRPGQVRVAFGTPVPPPDPTARSRRVFTAELHAQVGALCEQPVAHIYAPIPGLGEADAAGGGAAL